MLGCPISYGDQKEDGINLNFAARVALVGCIALGTASLFPMAAFAFNETEALFKIAELEEKVSKAEKSVGPISGLSCALAGACALKAKENIAVNNMNVAKAYMCGFAAAICTQRVANHYNL